ncbi:hypothetical protein WKV52_11410 [Tetragenococcus halophilus]|uniref:hypothetical protein n=1 Tax=Tetragenococcus halophilus TaxID=51669 RepID=UPI0030C92097
MKYEGLDLLNNHFLNKGTAFTKEERKENHIEGLLPPFVQTLDQQVEQAYENYSNHNHPSKGWFALGL